MTTAEHTSPSGFVKDLLASSAPRRRGREPRLRDLIAIGQRLRNKNSGRVVRVVQVHRVDRLVEVQEPADDRLGPHAYFGLPFHVLAAEYELLVPLDAAR